MLWPPHSPPDSGLPLICGDNIGGFPEPGYTENLVNTQYFPETFGVTSPQSTIIDFSADRPDQHNLPNVYQYEGSIQSTNDGSRQFLDQMLDNPAAYEHNEVGPCHNYLNCLQEIPPHLMGGDLSSSHEENLMQNGWDESAACRHDDPLTEYAGITHPQSGPVKIEGASEPFQFGVAASFHFTAECFPESWPVDSHDEPRHEGEARSRSSAWQQPPASRNSRVNRKLNVSTTMPPLSVIHEDGKGGLAFSQLNTMKGRRVGPLSKSKAAQAAKNRREKSVCIRCKMMKQSVSCIAYSNFFQICRLTVSSRSVQGKYLAEAVGKTSGPRFGSPLV